MLTSPGIYEHDNTFLVSNQNRVQHRFAAGAIRCFGQVICLISEQPSDSAVGDNARDV